MKIGILVTSVGDFGKKGYYNAQEVGLAKELDKLYEEIIIYKAVPWSEEQKKVTIEGCTNTVLYQIPVKSSGINGMWNCRVMDSSLDALLYFSDTQLSLPKVYRWCCYYNIKMYPYIGVIESHSISKLRKHFVNVFFRRNIAIYRKCICFVKTPSVEEALNNRGVKNCIVAPVGLDVSLLHQDYKKTSIGDIKRKYGYQEKNKIVLFIGRMTEEKQPLRMIEIFNKIYEKDKDYRLIMVGKGELLECVRKTAEKIKDVVLFIEKIPNKDIWELYRMACAFVNLNQQEIFGMSILEAMYYECKVVAWKAPGPDYIIDNLKSGYIVKSVDEAIDAILKEEEIKNIAHVQTVDKFTWMNTAKIIRKFVK